MEGRNARWRGGRGRKGPTGRRGLESLSRLCALGALCTARVGTWWGDGGGEDPRDGASAFDYVGSDRGGGGRVEIAIPEGGRL